MAVRAFSPALAGGWRILNSRNRKRILGRVSFFALIAFLIAVSVVSLLPILWMLSTSLKLAGREFEFPIRWLPEPITWNNYITAWNYEPLGLYLRNTAVITAIATAGTVLTASMAGYSFARLQYRGRTVAFSLMLATLMLPGVVMLIPQFIIFKNLGWIDTFLPLIVPFWLGGHPFYIFLFRQFFLTLPVELEEAARVDGASTFHTFFKIILPLCKPVLATVTVFSIMLHWNDFIGPLIYLNSKENRTLALGIALFRREVGGTEWNLFMAASMIMVAPIIAIFFAAQRMFVSGIALTGLTGR